MGHYSGAALTGVSRTHARPCQCREMGAGWPAAFAAGPVLGEWMNDLLREYLPVLIFIIVAGGLAAIMVVTSLVVAKPKPDSEKLSPYECGFEAFDNARRQFDVRFYLVSILFIIFDLEVAFLFPWAVSLGKIGIFGFWSMMIFLGVLTVGFVYEWKKGALEWE